MTRVRTPWIVSHVQDRSPGPAFVECPKMKRLWIDVETDVPEEVYGGRERVVVVRVVRARALAAARRLG